MVKWVCVCPDLLFTPRKTYTRTLNNFFELISQMLLHTFPDNELRSICLVASNFNVQIGVVRAKSKQYANFMTESVRQETYDRKQVTDI